MRYAAPLMTWLERLLGAVLLAAVVLNFGNVVARYIFNTALISADEVQVFGLIAITFLGAAIVSFRSEHLRMDVLRPMMPSAVQFSIRLLEAAITLVVIGFVGWQSWRYVTRVWTLGQTSDMAHIPMWIPHGLLLAGFVLMAGVAVLRLFAPARSNKTEAETAKDQRI